MVRPAGAATAEAHAVPAFFIEVDFGRAADFVQCLGVVEAQMGGDGIVFGGHQPDVRMTLARIDYDRWLDSFRRSEWNQTLQALLSGPDENSKPSRDDMESVK